MMRFDLTDLRLFLNVVETGSITAGADRSHLALASASARISGMEKMVGTALLERRRRGVIPTTAGRLVVDHARLICAQIERMKGDLSGYTRGIRATIRVLANTAAASEYLVEPLSEFLLAHPAVDIELRIAPSQRIGEQIAAGKADIGIAAANMIPDFLVTKHFQTDALAVIFPSGHHLENRAAVTFNEIVRERFVALPSESALQVLLDERVAALGDRIEVRIRAPDLDALCRMVLMGVGVGVVPAASARRNRVPDNQVVSLDESWALRDLVVCTRGVDKMPLPARELYAALAAHGSR